MSARNSILERVVVVNGIEYKNVNFDLEARNDIAFALASKNFPVYKNRTHRTPREINQQTLASQRVKDAIDKQVTSGVWSPEMAKKQAEGILQTMAHNFNMASVRTLAYPAKKILRSIFKNGIYVNEDVISRLKAICVQNPVVFAPSHRTYMDFILLQFLCYHYELPLPAIASAQDFLQMEFMSEMLRKCGAYFIRRTFNDDEFYKALFTKYVQTQVINGDSTMAAFVEGTRSRTGKSLCPKYGFLSTILEPFLAGHVYDITIVPINISYGRLMEEEIYAYELLGYSKPPETTTGLFKARSLLGQLYGPAYFTFGEPISVRNFVNSFPKKLDRSVHTLPSNDYFSMTNEEQYAIKCLAHKIIKKQEKLAVVDVWPLMCLEIGRQMAYIPKIQNDCTPSINYFELLKNVGILIDLAERLGHEINLTKGEPLNEEFQVQFYLHSNLIDFHPDTSELVIGCDLIKGSYRSNRNNPNPITKHTDYTISRLMIANYANQCIHLFIEFAYLAANFRADQPEKHRVPFAILKTNFEFLQKLFAREFVCDIVNENRNFEIALEKAVKAKIFTISEENSTKYVNIGQQQDIINLKLMLEPYLISYYICSDFLTKYPHQILERDFKLSVQEGSFSSLFVQAGQSDKSNSNPKWFQILSADISKNCLHSLVDMGAIGKASSNNIENPSVKGLHFFMGHGNKKLLDIKSALNDLLTNFYETESESLYFSALEAKALADKAFARAKL
uniref:Phospholipid/glycerol acyltransferase domain-containing protein n=1 Tax=Romanomermis culicivorax TaxID=13658 RepID=A0A915HUA6_ROMCU